MVPKHHQKCPHLLQRIHPPCQHVEVVEGGDGGGQVTLGMIQLLDIPGDFLHLANEKGFWLNIKPQQQHFQERRSHSPLFGTVEVSAQQPWEHYRFNTGSVGNYQAVRTKDKNVTDRKSQCSLPHKGQKESAAHHLFRFFSLVFNILNFTEELLNGFLGFFQGLEKKQGQSGKKICIQFSPF